MAIPFAPISLSIRAAGRCGRKDGARLLGPANSNEDVVAACACHLAPFMTFTFKVAKGWGERVPEVVHEDGTSRAQVLQREFNPR